MLKFNSIWISDLSQLYKKVFIALDMDDKKSLNLHNFITLRTYNNAYNILLLKEEKVYSKNFNIGIRIALKKL